MVWLGGVHGWCVCIVNAIDVDSGFGRGVSEVQLVSWKTDNSAMRLYKVDSQYHREKVIATGLEPRTTQFLNEHSTIWPTGQFGQMVECSFKN